MNRLLASWPLWLASGALLVALYVPTVSLQRPLHQYLVVIDLSQSMWADDTRIRNRPATRLAMAKAAAGDLLRGLPCGARVGWGVFAERRTVILTTPVEVCEHYESLFASLEGIDQRMRWGEASGIGKGLHQSLRAAHATGADTAVVLITDGHEAPPLGPGQSGLPKSEDLSVSGLLAGVGGDTPVPVPRIDIDGNVIGVWQPDQVVQRTDVADGQSREELSYLHESHLRELARLAELTYARIENPDDLTQALLSSPPGRRTAQPVNVQWLPTALALLALCWYFRPKWPAIDPGRISGRDPGRIAERSARHGAGVVRHRPD